MKKGKVVAIVSVACTLVAAAVVVVVLLTSGSPGEKTVKQFMNAYMAEDFNSMLKYSKLDEPMGVFGYAGTKITGYKITDVSEPYKIKAEINEEYDEDFPGMLDTSKETYKNWSEYSGHELVILEDTPKKFVAESKDAYLDAYTVFADVSYTTLGGYVKNNTVRFTVEQSFLIEDEYDITEILGLEH